MALVDDDEPSLLLANYKKDEPRLMLVDENRVIPVLLSRNEEKLSESNLWYLDNGGSNHTTGCKTKFSTLDESIAGQVRFGDGSRVKIEGKGTVMLMCKNGEERALQEVYYIPSLRNNIISLGQMSEEGNRVILKGEFLWIYDKQETLLMKVRRSSNRLYKLIIDSNKQTCLLSKDEEVSKLWHARLSHVNYQALSMMSKAGIARGMPKITQPKNVFDGCLLSKQTRKQFPKQTNYKSTKVLELVHGDLCGPISPVTASGNRYLFLLVDDFSRFMWVYFLKNKDET